MVQTATVGRGGAVDIDVSLNPAQIKRYEKALAGVRGGMPRALSRAINKTASAARTIIKRDIAKVINVNQKTVTKSIDMERASRRRLQADIRVGGKRISLGRFGAQQKKKGASYKIKRGGARKTILHAFGPKIEKLGKGVFIRSKDGDTFVPRFPIVKMLGPSIGGVFEGEKKLVRRAKKQTNKRLGVELKRQVKILAAKANR